MVLEIPGLAEQLDKTTKDYQYKCNICKVDIPCVHQLDQLRLEGYIEGFHGGITDRVEMYGALLLDGDYEKYQPNIYIEPRTPENPAYIEALLEAKVQEYRALWIRNRLTEYLSAEWQIYNTKTMDVFEQLVILAKLAHTQGSNHYSIPYLLQLKSAKIQALD